MSEHTVTAFDEDLNFLVAKIAEMGGNAESMVGRSVSGLITADPGVAQSVVADDKLLDALQEELDDHIVLLIARRQPMAQDLREAIGALRMATDLERIGDLAKNIARRTFQIEDKVPPSSIASLRLQANLLHLKAKNARTRFTISAITRLFRFPILSRRLKKRPGVKR